MDRKWGERDPVQSAEILYSTLLSECSEDSIRESASIAVSQYTECERDTLIGINPSQFRSQACQTQACQTQAWLRRLFNKRFSAMPAMIPATHQATSA